MRSPGCTRSALRRCRSFMPATVKPMARLTSKLSAPDTSIQFVGMQFLPYVVGLIQYFDDVLDVCLVCPLTQSGLQLNHAARIRADDCLRPSRGDIFTFLAHESQRQIGLRQVIDAGA